MNKLPKKINIVGIIVIGCSITKWFFMSYDPSQLMFGVLGGITILGFAYIYDWMKEKDKELEKLNKRLDAFTDWWARQEVK